jgi:hypothetical protein
MGNVQNCDSYINIPSSQTYGCYSPQRRLKEDTIKVVSGSVNPVMSYIWKEFIFISKQFGKYDTQERAENAGGRRET